VQNQNILWRQLHKALEHAGYQELTESEVVVVREIWEKIQENAGVGNNIEDQKAFLSRFNKVGDVFVLEMIGFVEWYLYGEMIKNTWGGPFNGQLGRQAIFGEINDLIKFEAMVETGTFRGDTAEYMAGTSKVPVFTTEYHPRFHAYAKCRLRSAEDVIAVREDSRTFLARLAMDPFFPKERVFFYLDAHWGNALPLYDELSIIIYNWSEFVVMIDDFQVPDDQGYGYDDYGDGKALCLDYLALGDQPHLQIYWPLLPSEEETSMRRGCVILTSDNMLSQSGMHLQTLRR
jgi:hypothetical protein